MSFPAHVKTPLVLYIVTFIFPKGNKLNFVYGIASLGLSSVHQNENLLNFLHSHALSLCTTLTSTNPTQIATVQTLKLLSCHDPHKVTECVIYILNRIPFTPKHCCPFFNVYLVWMSPLKPWIYMGKSCCDPCLRLLWEFRTSAYTWAALLFSRNLFHFEY